MAVKSTDITSKQKAATSSKDKANKKTKTATPKSDGIKNQKQLKGKVKDSSVQDDGKMSRILQSPETASAYNLSGSTRNSNAVKDIYHSGNYFERNEIKNALYSKTFRFGLLNPYGSISTAREYLFFTKPDLNIYATGEDLIVKNSMSKVLQTIPFWVEMKKRKNTTIRMLQNSLYPKDPFNHLLQNQVTSNLDIPGLTSEMIDTPTNMFGVGFSYRGSSESSDDNPEFSLEFKDTRYLDTYMFFKCYEEYQMLKHHGLIAPSKYYIKNKILHDQFSIYKFIVDEDMETIIYYGKMYGVTPKSLPRDVFSNPNFDNGISYSIDFKAAFYEDMKPDILADFNTLSHKFYNSQPYQINPYNIIADHADTRPAEAAFVVKDSECPAAKNSPMGYVYKLKWRGSAKV